MRYFYIVLAVAVATVGITIVSGQGQRPAPSVAKLPDSPTASADEFVEITDQALLSAVKVMITKPHARPKISNPFVTTTPGPDSIGSGVVYKTGQRKEDGKVECLILTNHHVIKGAKTITVRFRNRLEYPAEVAGTDPITEVAVIRIHVPNEKAPPSIKIRKTALRIAEKVLAIGSPLDQPFSVSQGIVSALGRRPAIGTGYEDYIQTDAAVNPGNSGGPLIDARGGNLIGLNTAILGNTNLGIAFAIPADLAVEMAERMLSNKGRSWHGFVGLQIDDTADGVKVLKAMPRRDDQQPFKVNDILIGINGQKVTDARACRRFFDRCKPGNKVKVQINRKDKPVQLEVMIDDFEKHFAR